MFSAQNVLVIGCIYYNIINWPWWM